VTRRVASAKQGGQPDRYTDERFVGLGPSDHDFAGADLTRCAFQRDDLSGADLRSADLRWANLSGAVLETADLRWARLRGSIRAEASEADGASKADGAAAD